jgi:hypothetical protein
MDAGYRTPLLEFFRRGDVARDIRLLAAQGALAPRAHEQLGLLMLLVSDPDPDIAAAAQATIAGLPREPLAAFLARADAPGEMRAFFAERGIEPAAVPARDADAPILDTAPDPEPDSDASEVTADGAPCRGGASGPPTSGEEDDSASALRKIAALTVPQRIALAMKGTREERAILIRDPNKIVGAAVLSSPKLTETEVESIAKMASISDELLRLIAGTRAWVKNYGVVLALVRNPKTPLAVSMNLLARLNERDVRVISQDRNVPDVLRITARKKVVIDK